MVAHHALEILLAKDAIRDVVLRYCRGIDRGDRELVRGCYWPDATDEHGSFTGTRDEFVEWVFDRLLAKYDWSWHLVGNVLVEVDLHRERARCETYGESRHHRPSDRPEHNLVTGFRYVDDFSRRDGEWRIQRRRAIAVWSRIDVPETRWEFPAAHRRGARDRTDPVYDAWPAEEQRTT